MVREKGDSSVPGVSLGGMGLRKQERDKIRTQF